MAEQIIDGIGSGYMAQVDNTHRLMVRTEGITVGSLSVSAGSETWIKNWDEIGSSVVVTNLYAGSKVWPGATFEVSGTIVGSIVSMPSVSVTTGSEVYIKGGSTTVYNRVAGSIVDFPGYLGSKVFQGDRFGISGIVDLGNAYLGSKFYQGDRFGVSGIVDIQTRVAGSIVNLPNVVISNPSTIGSYTTQEILGSVAITSPISVSAGSESYIKGGSIEVYTGSIYVTNFSAGTGYAGSDVYQGTDPWIIEGSVAISSPISVATGSESYIKGGSIAVYNQVAGSIVYMPDISVSTGSESWIKNWDEIGSSVVVTNLYAGSKVFQGDIFGVSGIVDVSNRVAGSIVNWPGSLAISNFNAIGSSVIVTNFNTLGSSVVVTNFNDLGSNAVITNFNAIGSSRIVTNLYDGSSVWQGEVWGVSGIVIGSFALTNNIYNSIVSVSGTYSHGSVNAISGTSVQILAGVAGKQVAVYSYKLACSGGGMFNWKDGTIDLEGPQSYAPQGGVVESVTPPAYLFKTSQGSALNLGTTGSVAGRVSYYLL